MRCFACGVLSWHVICNDCLENLSLTKPSPRVLENGLKVYSFFSYSNVAPLLHVKHLFHGHKVYELLAKASFSKFVQDFEPNEILHVIPIDDHVRSGYSHTAILAKALKSKNLKIHYNSLRSTSNVSYSGKSLNYRKANPRCFTCKLKKPLDIILVDDIITTGSTLLEASMMLKEEGHNPLFALTLADAKDI